MSFFIRPTKSIGENERILRRKKRQRDEKKKKKKKVAGSGERGNDDDSDEIDSDDVDDDVTATRSLNDNHHADDGDDDNARETAQEKKVRLAKQYLEEVRKREGVDDDADIRGRLEEELLQRTNRLRKAVAAQYRGVVDGGVTFLRCREQHRSVTCVAVSCDASHAFMGSKDGVVVKWRLADACKVGCVPPRSGGVATPTRKELGSILCLAVSWDGRYLASAGGKGVVHVWCAATLAHKGTLRGHAGAVTGVAFRRGTHTLFSCSQDRTVRLWEVADMAYVETLHGHQSGVAAVDALFSLRAVSVGGADATARLWKVTEEAQLLFDASSADGGVWLDCVATLDEQHFLTGGSGGRLCLWSVLRKRPLATAAAVDAGAAADAWLCSVAALINTDVAASASSDGLVRLWRCDVDARRLQQVLAVAVAGYVNGLAFAPDGSMLVAAAAPEHRLGRWRVERGGAATNCGVVIPLVRDTPPE